ARSAFTLLEVLIVVAILVVLAGVSSIYVFSALDDAKADRCKADVQTLSKACQMYQLKFGEWPPSLDALLQPPDGSRPYLESPDAILDSWRQPYQYDASGGRNNGLKPDIWTVNKTNGQTIGNWPGGSTG